MYDYVIIDPTSTEFNRGGFCYLPYILCSVLKSMGNSVCIIEDFTVADLDKLPKAHQYLVGLWSYPQIETCLVINKFLYEDIKFFGYTPLINHLNLPLRIVTNDEIKGGIYAYPNYFSFFNYLLLSDCDMHLKKYKGQVYPLCTSYGCPRGCAFCPSTVNCGKERIVLSLFEVNETLEYFNVNSMFNIHFTDEDFFFDIDHAYSILKIARDIGVFNIIALGSAPRVQAFCNKYGTDIIEQAGMKLIEIGFETADPALSKAMGKPTNTIDKYEKLIKSLNGACDIFWLTMTFFPGETITTLNKTGEFLRNHGFSIDEVYGRLRTNGTHGGLGQFFQGYHGTKGFKKLKDKGVTLTERPVRLLPSFIPHSFLDSQIKEQTRDINKEDKVWFDLYKVPIFNIQLNCSIRAHCSSIRGVSLADKAVFFALCARLGIIK